MPTPMRRLIEILLGLKNGFLSEDGSFAVRFNPQWPGQGFVGAATWNVILGALALGLVIYVYRRDGRSRSARILLGALRGLLLAFLIALLNRPVLTLGQSRIEPSVLAIALDESLSMRVPDVTDTPDEAPATQPISRRRAVVNLLNGRDGQWLKSLAREHQLRLYAFDRDARPLGSMSQSPAEGAATAIDPDLERSLAELKGDGQSTQVARSLNTILDDLQGQRLAGVVMLTDGRDSPELSAAEALRTVKQFGAKVYAVAVGSQRPPKNVSVQIVPPEESAFKGDVVNVRAMVRGSGFPAGHPVRVSLKNRKTGELLKGMDSLAAEKTVDLDPAGPVEVELQFRPEQVGPLDLIVEAEKQPGEIDEDDNTRSAQLSVLEAKIRVLYVEGYPRWDYRYLKNEMIRDKTVDISCLLTSADPSFAQEGDIPIRFFPESMSQLMDYDVVLMGDVDPRQFTDVQLQLIRDFVGQKGGGFGMVAGPRFAPQAYRNTAVEPLLPVSIAHVDSGEARPTAITSGFRPVLTREGAASGIFRFFPDRAANEKFLADEIQPIFWYCRGVQALPGIGEVYAQHPTDTGPDGRKAPLLVLGRFGAGRTLFSAIDDSWRWRFYTGENIFNTYWVQQLRYLARSKKLGQRRVTFTSLKPGYELGEQVTVTVRVLDPAIAGQLSDQLRVQVLDGDGAVARTETLLRQDGQDTLYRGSWTADRIGSFVVRLSSLAGGIDMMELPVEVRSEPLEFAKPMVNRELLASLASEGGAVVELADADQLPAMIKSAQRKIPLITAEPLWDAPLALAIFMALIVSEWILRKMYGML